MALIKTTKVTVLIQNPVYSFITPFRSKEQSSKTK